MAGRPPPTLSDFTGVRNGAAAIFGRQSGSRSHLDNEGALSSGELPRSNDQSPVKIRSTSSFTVGVKLFE